MHVPNIYFPHLNWAFYIEPIAFKVFGLPIYWYGLIMTSAICLGTLLTCFLARKEGLQTTIFTDYVLYTIFIAIIGARLYFVAFHWDYYRQNLRAIFNIRQGGIAIYGAVLASVVTAVIYTRSKRIPFLQFADLATYGLLLGQIIGRYGNFFNMEAYGGYTNQFFAMALLKEKAKPPISADLLNHLVQFPQFGGATYIQVHPTFLYESLWNLFLLIILLVLRKRRRYSGIIFFTYLIGYGIGRFWIEGLRVDQLLVWGTHYPISQIIAILSIIMGIIGIIFCRKGKRM